MFHLFVDGDPILQAILLANRTFIIGSIKTSSGLVNEQLDPESIFLLYCIIFFDTTAEVSDHQYLPNWSLDE